jgi:hypothetical protein
MCPNVTYALKEGTVVTTPATDFQKASCASIKPGDDIKVEGVELEGGIIRATVVTKKEREFARKDLTTVRSRNARTRRIAPGTSRPKLPWSGSLGFSTVTPVLRTPGTR